MEGYSFPPHPALSRKGRGFYNFFRDPLTEQHFYSNDYHNQCYYKTGDRDEVPSFEKARALSEENKGESIDERFLYSDASTTCFPRPQ